ncbi:MAG: cadherin-like domain-containing protein [Saprospiraceae bacterium]|nr:cadherin-like domain-containing protein [Saprospiraceae bacterium]
MTIDNVSVPGSTTYCPAPEISITPTNVTCAGGNNGSILVTATGGLQPYNVSWSGASSGNPGGTEIVSSGGMYNITNLVTGMYNVTVTDANSLTAVANTTLIALNPAENAAFAYPLSGYCRAGSDPLPQIYGNTGGTFTAPVQVSINPVNGLIDVSASTAGGPYNITYTTNGPCPAMMTFAVTIVNCQPGASLSDNIIIDNGALAKADPGDRIRLAATISNTQTANYEGMQITLNNDPRVTFVNNSFKTTPVAVDDAYNSVQNTLLTILVANGLITNDFDENKPGLSVTSFNSMSVAGGTVVVNPNGSFTYNPPNGFTGNDSFNYTITDSDLQTNSATVKIRVQ